MAGGFTLTITDTRTPAFGESANSEQAEVARVLQTVVQRIGSGDPTSGTLHDRNGNRIGRYTWELGSLTGSAGLY